MNNHTTLLNYSLLYSNLKKFEKLPNQFDAFGHATNRFNYLQELYILTEQLKYILTELHTHHWNDGRYLEKQLFTEMFYYKSFRFLDILKDHFAVDTKHKKVGSPLYNITHVRNNLIEHPEGKNGRPGQSIAWQEEKGGILKPMDDSFSEPGVFEVANKFYTIVNEKLSSPTLA